MLGNGGQSFGHGAFIAAVASSAEMSRATSTVFIMCRANSSQSSLLHCAIGFANSMYADSSLATICSRESGRHIDLRNCSKLVYWHQIST